MIRYKKHLWMSFEKNPDFQRFTSRYGMGVDFWSLKDSYNKGEITNPASNEFITYSELFLHNVFLPVIEEFFYPKHERFKQFSRVIADAIIKGQFEGFVFKNEQQLEAMIEQRVEAKLATAIEQEKKRLLDELVAIEETEIPDAGFYHEYEKKSYNNKSKIFIIKKGN